MVTSTLYSTLLVAVLADRCHLADVKFGPQMTTSSMVKKPLLIIFYFVTVKHMMEEVRKLSEGGIALEFRQSFCSQAFPLLASPHNDIQRAVMTVEKQQVSPPHLWQQLMAHLVFRFLDFHCCK